MLRRNARLRREYLYRKSLEGKDREEYERKLKIRRALEGQPLVQRRCISKDIVLHFSDIWRIWMSSVLTWAMFCWSRGQAHSNRAAQGGAGIAAQHRAGG